MRSKLERSAGKPRLRVLFVPDSVHWITGTMCKNIVRFNPWIEGTILSGPLLDEAFRLEPALLDRFDLVHFLDQYGSREWLPRFRERMPVVTTHHHVADWELDKHNMEGDCIMVVAREWEEDLRQRGIDMSRVFRYSNGVDVNRFVPATSEEQRLARGELGIPESSFTVGFFAKRGSNNHNDRKGTDVFIEAVAMLGKEELDTTVLIVGPGWTALVDRLIGLGVRCVWRPFIEGDIAPLYHALDAYWITSRIEGGPVPLLEAMSSAICCVTTSVGLVPEIGQSGKNLVVVPFNDAEAVVKATVDLARSTSKREAMGILARETMVNKKHLGVTTRAVGMAYQTAINHFKNRCPGVRVRIKQVAALTQADEQGSNGVGGGDVPLNGIPRQHHHRLRMLENLNWADALFDQGQRRTAHKWLRRECFSHPLSPTVWRRYLRRAMPPQVVKCLVKLRHRIFSEPG